MPRYKMKAISLFSGMGGDTLGIENAGLKVIAFSEFWDKAIQSHLLNFTKCKWLGKDVNGNITKINDEEFNKYKDKVDLIFAGFPCQGFSKAGKKIPDDPRNTLFKEFLRATKCIRPKYIIGENVKGLLNRKTHDGKNYIDIIKLEFENIGYKIGYKVFKCHKYGVPQKRERLLIIGIRNDLNKVPSFPPEEDIHLNLNNVVKFNMKGAVKLNNYDMTNIPNECILTDLNNEEDDIGDGHPYLKSKIKNNLISFGKRISPNHSEIIDIRNPTKTIICAYSFQPRFYVPLKNKNGYYLRVLLPDELKQIQSFPKKYKLFGNNNDMIKQIGNAVPPKLIEKVVKHLIKN